jgi:hypothetical protein
MANNNILSGGLRGINYLGTNATNPPNIFFRTTDPTIYTIANYSLGDFWINSETETVFMLLSVAATESSSGYQIANWVEITTSAGTLTQLDGDTGSATPTDGEITIAGGSNITTSATASTVTVSLDNSIAVSGDISANTGIVTAQGVVATSLGITSTSTISASGLISSSAGNITANQALQAGTTVTAGTDVIALGNALISDNLTAGLVVRFPGSAGASVASSTPVYINTSTGQIGTVPTASVSPGFLAVLSATATNVTGNGTLYTIIPNTEISDRGGNYNNGTGVFTAPQAGYYQLWMSCTVVGTTIATNIQIRIVTTSNTYINTFNRAASSDNLNLNLSVVAPMAVGDTALIRVVCSGEAADTDDVFGDGTTQGTCFGGVFIS